MDWLHNNGAYVALTTAAIAAGVGLGLLLGAMLRSPPTSVVVVVWGVSLSGAGIALGIAAFRRV